jgi:hypothetical protein
MTVARPRTAPDERRRRDMADGHVSVEAERLPGIGWRYSVPLDPDRLVTIVVEDGGARHLAIVDPATDDALSTMRLSESDASVVAALLTGARFHLDLAGAAR